MACGISAAEENPYKGIHYLYLSNGAYGRMYAVEVKDTEGTYTGIITEYSVDENAGSRTVNNAGQEENPADISYTVDGNGLTFSFRNFRGQGADSQLYTGVTRILVDGYEVSYEKADGALVFTTTRKGSLHILQFRSASANGYDRVFGLLIDGTSGTLPSTDTLYSVDTSGKITAETITYKSSAGTDNLSDFEYSVSGNVITIKFSNFRQKGTNYHSWFVNLNNNNSKVYLDDVIGTLEYVQSSEGNGNYYTLTFEGVISEPGSGSESTSPSTADRTVVAIAISAIISAAGIICIKKKH